MQCNVSHLFYITWKRSSHTNDQSRSPFLLPFERSNLKDLLLGVSGQLDSVYTLMDEWEEFGGFVLFELNEIWLVCVVQIK